MDSSRISVGFNSASTFSVLMKSVSLGFVEFDLKVFFFVKKTFNLIKIVQMIASRVALRMFRSWTKARSGSPKLVQLAYFCS
jgi:hypothetical protein